ncbi:MAG TPA: TetR/AcrR family transcriptional regulator [Acidimicrobiia bacterium]|nr:TetR/AcrR family transcriptional regulator [Acidimicrobiia bacterium]
MSADEALADESAATVTRRELAVSRAIDQARSRAEHRVQLFLDAARELMAATNSGEFTVQEVVERSGQSLRTFYQYFPGKHELLLALFEESIRVAAAHLEEVVAEGTGPFDRLHRFAVEYYRMCRVSPNREPRRGPPPAMVEFAQRLLTSHPQEAAQAFSPIVDMLERLLVDATAAGEIRGGLDDRRIAGVVLQATMFNAFATTISGSSSRLDADADPELLWELLIRGIGVDGWSTTRSAPTRTGEA